MDQRVLTNDGFVFDSVYYQFGTTGLSYAELAAATYVISPYLPGAHEGIMRFRISGGLVDIQFPPYAAAGRYSLTMILTDGRKFSVGFAHMP